MERKKSKVIREFIAKEVGKSSRDIVRLTGEKFGITRQAVNRHIHWLIDNGVLVAEGSTRQRKYKLRAIIQNSFTFHVSHNLKEDVVWREKIRPLLDKIPPNVLDICHYGVTEMVNNVIDHSVATLSIIEILQTSVNIQLSIFDNGIGIFKKIQKAFELDDPAYAILELAKGKLTTDPKHHTGEGIFFSSRMFDRFIIQSSELYFAHNELGHDWLLGFEKDDDGYQNGTLVKMEIGIHSTRTAKEVFDKYSAENDDYGFTRTIVPVVLAKYGDENLISRSQAKRLLARLEKFREVMLDFENVETIGQAFADEIFRVFQQRNPHIHLMHVNANKEVNKSILRAIQNGDSTPSKQPTLF